MPPKQYETENSGNRHCLSFKVVGSNGAVPTLGGSHKNLVATSIRTYKTIGEALEALHALLLQGLQPGDALVEVAFKEVRQQADLLETRVLELEKRVEGLEAKVEEAAVERKDIMTALLKVLDHLKIIESPSTY